MFFLGQRTSLSISVPNSTVPIILVLAESSRSPLIKGTISQIDKKESELDETQQYEKKKLVVTLMPGTSLDESAWRFGKPKRHLSYLSANLRDSLYNECFVLATLNEFVKLWGSGITRPTSRLNASVVRLG